MTFVIFAALEREDDPYGNVITNDYIFIPLALIHTTTTTSSQDTCDLRSIIESASTAQLFHDISHTTCTSQEPPFLIYLIKLDHLHNDYTNNNSFVVVPVDMVYDTWVLPTAEFHTLLRQ